MDSRLLRPQMRSIAHYILKVDAYNSKESPSRLHVKVSAVVSGKTASFFIIHFGAYSDRSCRVHVTRVIIICPVSYCLDSYFPVLFRIC